MTRDSFVRSRGLRRLMGTGSGQGSDVPAETEEIAIDVGHGSPNIDITSINGVLLTNFTHVQIVLDLVDGATDQDIHMRLRRKSDSTWISSAGYYRHSTVNHNTTQIETDQTQVKLQRASGTDQTERLIVWLSSLNQPCPTGFLSRCVKTTNLIPALQQGMTTTAEAHDGIRFIYGSASNWTAGTVYVTGYRCKTGTLYSHTFSTEATHDFTLAAGEVIGDVFMVNAAMTTAATNWGVQVGTGGTFLSAATDYRGAQIDQAANDVFETFGIFPSKGGGAQTGKYGWGSLYNLQTTVPVMAQVYSLDPDGTDTDPQEVKGFIAKSTTSYDQIRIAATSSTIASGTVYLQTYKPKQTVHKAISLVSHGDNKVDVTGLTKSNASLLVLGSYDASRASATGSQLVRVSTDGVTFDAGTGYNNTVIGPTAHSVEQISAFRASDSTSKAECGLMSVFAGVPQNTPTIQLQNQDMNPINSLVRNTYAGLRKARQTENAIRWTNDGAVNLSAGSFYAVGYSM